MPITKQLTLIVPNRPGQLARVTQALAAKQLNINAITIVDTADYGLLRMVVDNPERAATVLREAGYDVCTDDVLAISIPNRPGELAKLAQALAKVRVNISYIYSGSAGRNNALIVLKVNNMRRALKALEENAKLKGGA